MEVKTCDLKTDRMVNYKKDSAIKPSDLNLLLNSVLQCSLLPVRAKCKPCI